MGGPEPLFLRWRSEDVRVRNYDPRLSPHANVIRRLEGTMTITTEVATLRQVMSAERAYEVMVPDDGSEVRLRRRVVG